MVRSLQRTYSLPTILFSKMRRKNEVMSKNAEAMNLNLDMDNPADREKLRRAGVRFFFTSPSDRYQ